MSKATIPTFLTLGMIMLDPAAAQESMIVTGTRVPAEPDRIGSATTIITRNDIEQRQARYLGDILKSVPGFAMSLSGGVGAQTQTRVRGGEANHVLVLIDGVRANDPATSDEFRWEYLSAANVDRVEIVRGPQSALWGSDAVGAVVNIITRRDADTPEFDGYAEAGSNGTRNIGLGGSASLDSWDLTAALDSLDTDGTNISRTGSERDAASLDTASIGARYSSADGLTLDARLRASDATTDYDPIDFLFTGLPTDGNLVTESSNRIASFNAALPTQQQRVSWRFRADHYDSEHDNFVDNAEDVSTASQRLTLATQADITLDQNSLSLALEREDTDFDQRGPVGFGDPNQDQNMLTTSVVAEYRHFAGERWQWIISSRYDDHSEFDNALNGKLSASYRVNDSIRLRASAGTAQKTPTFTDRFGFYPAQFLGNPDLKPETSLSWDIGADMNWLSGKVTFASSLYWQELKDEIDGFAFDPDSFLFTAINLPGQSRRDGMEMEAGWQPDETLRFGLSYIYTDATEPTDQGPMIRELRRPEHAGSLSVSFTPSANRFSVYAAATYGGTRDDLFFPPFPAPQERVELADYWLVDLTAQYQLNDRLTLFVRGANLLDEDYEQVYGYATLGRAAYFGIRTSQGR